MTIEQEQLSGNVLKRQRSPDLWVLAAILATGTLVRGLYLGEIAGRPDFAAPVVDADYHQYWAKALATGDWTPRPPSVDPEIRYKPYVRPPGYPYFLSFIYRLAGTGDVAPRVVQMMLGLINCALAFVIGKKCCGSPVALTWAAFMALYWAFVYFEGEFHAPVLLIFLLLSAVYLLGEWTRRLTIWYAPAAGVFIGLASLVRPNALPLLLVAAAWMVFIARRRDSGRKGAAAAAALVFGGIVAISPATVRNYVCADDFVLISANGGINLFIGNNEHADGFAAEVIPGVGRFHTMYDYPILVASVEQQEGTPLKYSEVSSYFTARAVEFMRAHPLAVATLTLKKAALFWGPVEVGHNKEIHYEREFSEVLSRLPGDFSAVLTLAIAGGSILFLRRRKARSDVGGRAPAREPRAELPVLMALIVFTVFLAVLPFFVAGRYRLPIIPFLLYFAAYGVCSLGGLIRERRFLSAACQAACCAVGYGLLSIPIVRAEPDLARWTYDQGVYYYRLGDHARALEYYEQAVAIAPDMLSARQAVAELLHEAGQLEQAAAHLRSILQYGSSFVHDVYVAGAHRELGRILLEQDRPDQALTHYREFLRARPNDVWGRMEFARVLRKLGRIQQGIDQLELALTIQPDNADALFGLGLLLWETGRQVEAKRRLAKVVNLEPGRRMLLEAMGIDLEVGVSGEQVVEAGELGEPPVQPVEELVRQADQFAQVGRFTQAISLYQQALAVEPDDGIIHFKLAEVLAAAERFPQAIRHYLRAIERQPHFAAAHVNVGRAYGRLDDAPKAVRHYREAVRIDPDMLAAHYNLGIALGDALQRYQEAIDALNQALALVESTGRTDLSERIMDRINRYRGEPPPPAGSEGK